MIKKKLAKMLTTCLMSVFIIGTASMTVHAESVRETEPNNTMETAETIMANHETDSNIFTTTCAESDLLLQKMTLKI